MADPSYRLPHLVNGGHRSRDDSSRQDWAEQYPWSVPDSRAYSSHRPPPSASTSIFGSGNGSQRPTVSQRTPSNHGNLDSVSTLPSASSSSQRYEDQVRATVDRRRISTAEKDADDPTTPPAAFPSSGHDHQFTTPATLNRLFAVQSAISPDNSRPSSDQNGRRGYARQLYNGETAALPEHLYTRGLLGGRHSDIVVVAFGKEYKLHRLVLDRAPFFATALSEPWLESSAKEMTVRPEEIDASITQHAFELALKRLYGCPNVHEEDAHAVGLFATGCWLEMVDLIDSSIESILRQMTPETLSPLISLVTKNYYGRAGDKILASAKAMLCRDGWRMPLRSWDGVPSDIVREIIGGDGFFIDGEWDRWVLSKRILDRKLRARAIEAGLLEPGSRKRIAKAPLALGSMAVRFDSVSRRSTPAAFSQGVSDSFAKYVSLYTHPSVEPLLVLLDEGIHYIHLDFEQLQYIRQSRDVLGLPVMPEKVVSSALWQQMELRQRVMNAREADLELGLSVQATEDQSGGDTTMSINNPASPHTSGKGKQRLIDSDVRDFEEAEDYDSQSWDGTGRPRKFWIPSSDCNIVMGGTNIDPIMQTPNLTIMQRHAARLSATLHPEDVTWASDFATSTSAAPAQPAQVRPSTADSIPDAPVSYTHLPPFRFSAEFPAPRLLKERKRVYSRTVFYAGSLWNIYIQKVASARGHTKQLGVYLHRAKERETEEAVFGNGTQVETRIGRLERSMLITSREARRRRRALAAEQGEGLEGEESSGSAGDHDALATAAAASGILNSNGDPIRIRRSPDRKSGQRDVDSASTPTAPDFPSSISSGRFATPSTTSDSEEDLDSDSDSPPSPPAVPALPPYTDARPTIRTYFKIYSPSRGGRMLSVYESAPDKFNFSQSWGWKSSTLCLDEGMEGEEMQIAALDEGEVGTGDGGKEGGGKGRGDGRLRFMVVIGNI